MIFLMVKLYLYLMCFLAHAVIALLQRRAMIQDCLNVLYFKVLTYCNTLLFIP